jgi:hypothetical protein
VTTALREYSANWLTGGLHFIILVFAAQAKSVQVWPYALCTMTLVSFYAWMANYRRYRQIHDTPTSKVASAAQGYVELFGRSLPIPDSPVVAPLSGRPCCWYRYSVERKSNNKWVHEESGQSVSHFLLADDTGQCVVSPDGAEVLYAPKSTWTRGERRYTEWLLLPKQPLYALGEFRTTGGADHVLDESKDISHVLTDWKKDQPQLMKRFDANLDGTLDLAEWEAARREARRTVERAHAEVRTSDGVHLLCKPADRRIFLLAAEVPSKVGRRFGIWSWLHLLFFLGAGSASYVLFAGAR